MVSQTEALGIELQAVVWQLTRRLRSEATVPVPQLRALGWLDREGPSTTSRLAGFENIRPQSMAQTVADLEEAGWVTRRADENDRRQTLIELSEAGLQQLSEFRRSSANWVSHVIERDLDDDEQRALADAIELLRRVAAG